jgi:hypothetical protein
MESPNEKLVNFVKSLGFDEDEIKAINESENEDAFVPFVSKIKENYKSQILSDQSVLDEISKPHKDAIFGKIKQLSKMVRKEYGLDIPESELEKMPFEDLLKKAREKDKANIQVNESEISKKQFELLEELEELKNSIPEREKQIIAQYEERLNESSAKEGFSKVIESDPLATKENVSFLTDTIYKLVKSEGRKLIVDEKKIVHYVDSNNMPIRDEKGNVITPKKLVSNFLTMVNGSTYSQSGTTTTTIPKTNDLLAMMGSGFAR